MNLKDILVFLDRSAVSDGRLRLATKIAMEHHAYLSAAFLQNVRSLRFPFGLDVPRFELVGGIPTLGAPDEPPDAALEEIAEEHFRSSARMCEGHGEWYALANPDTDELINLARAADLVVMGQINPRARPGPTWKPEEIVEACGRPVLMVPYIGHYTQVGRRVLVAWDGSQQAVRAINDALPMISAAEAVTVMSVCPRAKNLEQGDQSMDRVVRHLTRHGITARTDRTLRGSNTVSDLLLSRAVDLAVDLIVVGASRHSPVRDALIGGVSHEIFQHMTVPVLMSH